MTGKSEIAPLVCATRGRWRSLLPSWPSMRSQVRLQTAASESIDPTIRERILYTIDILDRASFASAGGSDPTPAYG